MKKITIIAFAIMLCGSMITILGSCDDKGNNKCGKTMYSRNNESESHNMGQNCINCHKSGGNGEGCFLVGGTIYESNKITPVSGGNVKFYTGANGTGTLVTTLEIDKLGNTYTTNSVDFGSGLYPVVVSTGGQTKYMASTTTTGACNSCHGVSQEVIWVP